MAIFNDEVNTEVASLSFKIYGDTEDELSVLIGTKAQSLVLKFNREQCFEMAQVMLNAGRILPTEEAK